jgi:hypothetical protein
MKAKLLLFCMFLSVSCNKEWRYIGDGTFADRGAAEAIDQYILDLGPNSVPTKEYMIGRLPSTRFVMGFHVASLDAAGAVSEAKRTAARVEVALNTSDGNNIFTQKDDLANWVWTCSVDCADAFGYRRKSESLNDDPGTYFIPASKDSYTLKITILAGEEFFKLHAVSIMFRGGGWK